VGRSGRSKALPPPGFFNQSATEWCISWGRRSRGGGRERERRRDGEQRVGESMEGELGERKERRKTVLAQDQWELQSLRLSVRERRRKKGREQRKEGEGGVCLVKKKEGVCS
jgi:hypothetical protein